MAYASAKAYLQSKNIGKYNSVVGSIGEQRLNTYTENAQKANEIEFAEDNVSKNNGGFFGGIGYAFEKLGLGFLNAVEGIWDYTAGGLAKLFGADDWAEQQFANDWVNYNHADEWYNPSNGWKTVGDVTGGIGSSLPSMIALAAVGAATGGAAVPAMITTFLTAGLSAAGNATKEAYQETGELGGKEFGYGALVGITEGTVETFSDAVLAGVGSQITKSFRKDVVSAAVKRSLGKEIAKSFLSEGLEEVIGTFVEPYWKRLTYDPDAENASFQEIAYAGLVGGLSGAVMTGFGGGYANAHSLIKGTNIVNSGNASTILQQAQSISNFESQNHTGSEVFEELNSTYEQLQKSLEKTNGEIKTARQRMLLGNLQKLNTQAVFQPIITSSAENIYNNAEQVAERMNAYGYTDNSGKKITITADQIREGIDTTNAKTFKKSMTNALKTNSVLRTLSVVDATGQLMMDTVQFKEATLTGEKLSSQVDLNRFIETASEAELKAVSERLGINNWETITNDEFKDKITSFVEEGGVETYKKERLIVKDAQNINENSAQTLGKAVSIAQDGIYRFRSINADIAIVKNGETYRIYDYESGRLSNELTKAELDKVVSEINTQAEQNSEAVKETLEQKQQRQQRDNRLKQQAKEIDTYARENIKDYSKLSANGQSMVRSVIRQARAAGIAEADVLSYARVSAHTGLNIAFSKNLCKVATSESGDVYSDGFYDIKNNRIVVNPETKRTHESLLIHELTHVIYRTQDGRITIERGVKNMSDAEKQSIINRYRSVGRGSAVELVDELNAHYAEGVLTNKNIIEKLISDKTSLKEKILKFFKRSQTSYSEDEKLSKTAKSLYKRYKKLFDSFSAANRHTNGNITENGNSNRLALAKDDKNSYNNKEQKRLIDRYTETQYNKYGWIRANDVLSVNQWNDFNRKFAGAKNNSNIFNKSISGEYIIPVNDMVGKQFGVDNVLVFAKGSYQNPTITKVIKIDLVDETSIDYVRRFIYDNEKRANNQTSDALKNIFGEELISELSSRDFSSYQELKRQGTDGGEDLRVNGQTRNRNSTSNKNNVRYALPETDASGRQLSNEQRKYFENSKAVDENGKLVPVYHGTSNYFNTFKSGYGGLYGAGMYFTEDAQYAENYSQKATGGRVIEAYLNLQNPLVIKNLKEFDLIYDEMAYDLIDKNGFSYHQKKQNFDFNEELRKRYDGVIITDPASDQTDVNMKGKFYIAFEPNQIKNVDNISPTSKDDIRYALPEIDSNGKKLTKNQRDYFKDSQIVDENGRLIPVYHGTNSQFYTFRNRGSINGRSQGDGFYFATNAEFATEYGSRTVEAYLNIKTPFFLHEKRTIQSELEHRGYNIKELASKYGIKLNEFDGISWGKDEKTLLTKMGYDGVISVWAKDDTISTDADDRTVIVAYKANQIKEISNINPTIDNDIRYALNSDDQIKKLVAVHNISETQLSQAIKLGGLAVPSIAITNTELGHENFGNISLIFKSSTIDPANSQNKVYASDVYSKTFPKTVNKITSENLDKLLRRFNESAKVFGLTSSAIENDLEFTSKENAIYTLGREAFVKYQYLKEQGITFETKNKQRQGNSGMPLEYIEAFAQKHSEITSKYVDSELVEKLIPEITQVYNKMYTDNDLDIESQVSFRDADNFLYDVAEYNLNGEKAFMVLDEYDLIDKINAALNGKEDKFQKYLQDIVDEYYEDKKYFRNNTLPYTPSGNRRSFNALYTEMTLENVVSFLTGNVRNSEGFNFGTGNIRSVLSEQFKSLNQIRQAQNRLVSTEQMKNLKSITDEATFRIASEIGKLSSESNSFTATGNALNFMADLAKTSLADGKIISMFKEYEYKTPSAELISEIKEYMQQLKEYPTEYFEAKPQRAVGFDEVVEVIAPKGTNSNIIDYFEKQGTKVAIYDKNTNRRSDIIKNLPDDVRFALQNDEDERVVGGLTKGQRAKFVANNTKFKIYSKTDAESVINSIIEERLVFDDKYGSLSNKSKAEIIDVLFTKLNNTDAGYRSKVALDVADYIIENAVLEDMYTVDNSESMRILSVLRHYMHNTNLSGIQSEIKYKFDDKAKAINLVWGSKNSKQSPDVIAQELANEGIFIDSINEADIFFEMVDLYNRTRAEVNQKVDKQKLSTYGSEAKIEELRQEIARDVLKAYDEKGEKSKYARLVEKYTDKIATLTTEVKQARKKNRLINNIIDTASYLKNVATKREYVGAEVFNAPELTSWLKELGKLKYRSDLRKSSARDILLKYGEFYNTNNELLYDSDPNLNYIDENVVDALNLIKSNQKSNAELSLEELQAAQIIMSSAKHLYENYDQMILEGKKVRITEVAEEGIKTLQNSKNRVGKGFFNNIYSVFNKIIEPRAVIKSLENYDPNGILTRAYKQITNGETAAGVRYIELMSDIDAFFAANKRYSKRLTNEFVKVGDEELSLGQAISLYEFSKREQAQAGLYESGFSYVNKRGIKKSALLSQGDIDSLTSQFTATDREFIAIVEDFFNTKSKNLKTKADAEILGYTNASEDFYFPIKRDSGTIAKNITDARSLMADWANVYNFSFNKDVKTGAKNKLFISDVYSTITRHAKQLSTYAELTVPLKNFSQIYAKNVGTKTDVRTIRNTLNENVWDGTDRYLSKLFADIQGKATSNSLIEKLRGAYAKYQLGANAKVIVSQITSYPTAGIHLDFKSMTKGFVMKTNYDAMDKYCDYARARNYEKGVVKAEGVIDKVGKVGDVLTKPIQWTDRLTIGKLWNASQVQIEKDTGLKIGTVENMQKAGVLLEEVIRDTQPNYTNTERSELMRSDSDIVRSFTMFTSVPLKQLSRLVESVGEFNALRSQIKAGNASAEVQARYKQVKIKLGRTLASITIANLMYVMVGQFFKWLYNKDRDDDVSFIQDFFNDFVSTTVGMFPVVKDIYNYFANDYEFSNFAYDSVNSILSASKELFEMASKAVGGEVMDTSDYMKPLRDSLYAIGQITGLPFRNINNTVSGVIKRFSPSTAYKYNSMFYNAQYSSDLKAALEKGDTNLAETIMSLLLDEDKAGDVNSATRKKLIELYEKGYTVLPKSVGDSLTYNGETITLTAKQKSAFKAIYSQANTYVEKLLTNITFLSLSDEKQAKAIKQIYDVYYDKALASLLGIDADNNLLLLSEFISMEKLSSVLAGISDITSDTDDNGKTISSSKKKNIITYLTKQNLSDGERLLLIYYKGYSLKDGEYKNMTLTKARTILLKYILNLKGASQSEKIQLAEMCDFTVENGKIVTSSI